MIKDEDKIGRVPKESARFTFFTTSIDFFAFVSSSKEFAESLRIRGSLVSTNLFDVGIMAIMARTPQRTEAEADRYPVCKHILVAKL